jgi:pSer/pThr/pTyr-binding forkhead associated (FHA) protein
MEAHFTVLSGPFRGQTFPIPRGKFILGREHDCHLVLDTNSVSRHHCVLLMDDYALRIRDQERNLRQQRSHSNWRARLGPRRQGPIGEPGDSS